MTPKTSSPSEAGKCWCQPHVLGHHPNCPMHGEVTEKAAEESHLPSASPDEVCKHCGPYCIPGAAHNARVEDGVLWTANPSPIGGRICLNCEKTFDDHINRNEGKYCYSIGVEVTEKAAEPADDELTDEVCPNCGEEGVPYGAYCHQTDKPWSDPTAPPVAEEGAAEVMEMARSGAVIRQTPFDLYFVDWGNVHFGTTLKGLGDLAHDLNLFVTRKNRELEDKR